MNNHIHGFDTRKKTRLTNSFIGYVYQGHPIELLEENCNLLPYSAHLGAIEVFGRFLDRRMIIVKALL